MASIMFSQRTFYRHKFWAILFTLISVVACERDSSYIRYAGREGVLKSVLNFHQPEAIRSCGHCLGEFTFVEYNQRWILPIDAIDACCDIGLWN
jgi:hypothetical protein